jgi:hypothetical protein
MEMWDGLTAEYFSYGYANKWLISTRVKKSEEKQKAAIEKKEVSRVNLQSFSAGKMTQRRDGMDRAWGSAGG